MLNQRKRCKQRFKLRIETSTRRGNVMFVSEILRLGDGSDFLKGRMDIGGVRQAAQGACRKNAARSVLPLVLEFVVPNFAG